MGSFFRCTKIKHSIIELKQVTMIKTFELFIMALFKMKRLLVFLWACVPGICAPFVTIDDGILVGTKYELPNGKLSSAFYGIPYGIPPVGEYRFKPPEKVNPWKGVYNASIPPGNCLQFDDILYEVNGDEDCLYLNVFTPKIPSKIDKLLDVMVYIHGGGFMFGGGFSMRPKYIMKDNDIVFVSINYRLGILGFMSTGDTVVPGNNGLKDQNLALKWIKKNIENFGGNPNSITLAGSSAGGASVHYHYLSKVSDGLFHRGISFSGSVLLEWTLPRNNTEKSIHVAAMAGCSTSDHKEMLACLQQRPGRQIVELSRYFTHWLYEPFTTFGPIVEPENENSFLAEEPLELLRRGDVKDLPWLVSLCKEEGLYRMAEIVADDKLLRELDEKWDEIAPHVLMYNYATECNNGKKKISDAIRKHYFGNRRISRETIQELIQMNGDRAFYNGITRALKLQASVNQQKVFCYKFSYRGKYSLSNVYTKNYKDFGVSHADDVQYVVTLTNANVLEMKADAAMVDVLGKVIKNFMKTGDPRIRTDIQWEAVSKNKINKLWCLEIRDADKMKLVDYENTHAMNFWANILPTEYPSLLCGDNDEL